MPLRQAICPPEKSHSVPNTVMAILVEGRVEVTICFCGIAGLTRGMATNNSCWWPFLGPVGVVEVETFQAEGEA